MKKYMSFYHLVVEAVSDKSGNREVFFDDYYTPQIAGTYEQFRDKVKKAVNDWNILYCGSQGLGGRLEYTVTTCCFNNGTGRSLSAQTNIQGYSVKENCPPLEDMAADKSFQVSMGMAVKWLEEQEPPF